MCGYSVKKVGESPDVWVIKQEGHPGWVDHRHFRTRELAEEYLRLLLAEEV